MFFAKNTQINIVTMKTIQVGLKRITLLMLFLLNVLFLNSCNFINRNDKEVNEGEQYTVAAYVWPSQHDESLTNETYWDKGIGEWEVTQKGNPRFEGHYQPRVPLWGYVMDDDPKVWEKKIEAATDHGVNAFIFDWYWYDGQPFLEDALNEGFLKAKNSNKAMFYLMWANHDMFGKCNPYKYPTDSLILSQKLDFDNFKIIVDRVINQYFKKNNYFKINDKPVFSIYNFTQLVEDFKGLDGTKKIFDYFRQEVKKAGFPGLHIQLIGRGINGDPHLLGGKFGEDKSIDEIISMLGINSVTTYNWTGSSLQTDYIKWGESAMNLQDKWDSVMDIPYFPNVSIEFDDTPRYPEFGKERVVHINKSPDSFAAYLQKARDYVRNHPGQPKLITVFAWNEWIEGSYLEPDMKWGYSYLEAVEKVMSGKYDKYSLIRTPEKEMD